MKNLILLVLALGSLPAFAEETKTGLSNESALGIVVTTGNSETSTISIAQKNAYIENSNVYKFAGAYLRSSNTGIEQARQWSLGVRYERELNALFNLYVAETASSDRYQGIDQRYASDVGGKYYFEKNEAINWFAEIGYRFARENYPYGFKNLNFARIYSEVERFFRKGLSAKLWAEYLPNITVWKAYQLNTELSLNVALSDVFSLKTAYQLRYYNEPPAGVAHTTDTTFTTSLVAKF